jgi:hypothetical protein
MDVSDGGVRISIPHDVELPDKLILLRYSGNEARYTVVWRKGHLIGAQIIGKRRQQTIHSVGGAAMNAK